MSEATRSDPSLSELVDLTGEVVLVTGAGQGVGAATARLFATQGAVVAVNDYYPERAQHVTDDITAHGGKAMGIAADITAFDEVTDAVAEITARLGTVSILVNNAGSTGANPTPPKPFWETDPAGWEPYLGVNLFGALSCSRAVLPVMIDDGRGGRIITVISDAGRVGEAGLGAHSAAKAGPAGLTRALARSLGRFDITANCVAIGMTKTPATTKVLANEAMVERILSHYIIRRAGEPIDAAAMIGFLASRAGSWITGQTYPVNGGFSVNQ